MLDFSTLQGLTIPEGVVTQITDASGRVIWRSFNLESLLADFVYTENADGTYTITDWKGTYKGKPSTEIIIPDDPRIVL